MPDLSQLMGFGEINRTPYGPSRPGFTGMMTGIMNNRDKAKQLKSWDAAAKAIYSALEPEADMLTGETKAHPMGMNKDQFNMLSTPDRVAKVKGVIEAEVLKSAFAEQKQKAQAANMLMEERRRGMADEESFRGMAQSAPIARAMAEGRGPIRPGPTTLQDVMQAATANPTARSAVPLIEQGMRQAQTEGAEDLSPNWLEDPTSGMRFLGRGRTTLPSGMNPDKAVGNLPEIPGFSAAPTGRGGFTWVKTPTPGLSPKDLLSSYQAELKALDEPGSWVGTTPEQRAAHRAELQSKVEALRSGGSASDPASRPNVTQEEYAALKKGDKYWWNGKQATKK